MLHARVNELERELTRQASEFISRDQARQIHFEELLKLRDAEIARLQVTNQVADEKINDLKTELEDKVHTIDELNDKCRVLDQVLQCKPVLDSMVKLLAVYQSCHNTANTQNHLKSPEDTPKSTSLDLKDSKARTCNGEVK